MSEAIVQFTSSEAPLLGCNDDDDDDEDDDDDDNDDNDGNEVIVESSESSGLGVRYNAAISTIAALPPLERSDMPESSSVGSNARDISSDFCGCWELCCLSRLGSL